MAPVSSMPPGTWNDIRPNTFCSSPESGWKADLYSCWARLTCGDTSCTSRVTSPLLSRVTCHLCLRGARGLRARPVLLQQLLGLHQGLVAHQPVHGVGHPGEISEPAWNGVVCYVIIVTANIWSSPMKVAWSHGLVSRSILAVSVLAPMISAGVLTSLQSPAAAPCLQLPLLGSAVVVSLVPPPVVWVGCR